MNTQKTMNAIRTRRARRARANIHGTLKRPRLSVFASNKAIAAQLIDDVSGRTLASASSLALSALERKTPKVAQASRVGTLLGQKAVEHKITAVVFDRGAHRYHGRVRALAEAVRAVGIAF